MKPARLYAHPCGESDASPLTPLSWGRVRVSPLNRDDRVSRRKSLLRMRLQGLWRT